MQPNRRGCISGSDDIRRRADKFGSVLSPMCMEGILKEIRKLVSINRLGLRVHEHFSGRENPAPASEHNNMAESLIIFRASVNRSLIDIHFCLLIFMVKDFIFIRPDLSRNSHCKQS